MNGKPKTPRNADAKKSPTPKFENAPIKIEDTAEKSTILVISRNKERKPWGRLVNLEKVL